MSRADPSQPLGGADPAWRRRSDRIQFLRRALPIGIAAIVVLLIGWIGVSSLLSKIQAIRAATAEIKMTNPRFYGQDEQGSAFVLGADTAIRQNGLQPKVRLFSPHVHLQGDAGKETQVTATGGLYDEKSRMVDLAGGVHLRDSGSGFDFTTAKAHVDTRAGSVTGDSPVQGTSPLGQISGSSYAVYDQGQHIVIQGGVRSRLNRTQPTATPVAAKTKNGEGG